MEDGPSDDGLNRKSHTILVHNGEGDVLHYFTAHHDFDTIDDRVLDDWTSLALEGARSGFPFETEASASEAMTCETFGVFHLWGAGERDAAAAMTVELQTGRIRRRETPRAAPKL